VSDVVSNRKRSEMMAGIRSKNTHPEIAVRQWLYGQHIGYRLHLRDLPGTPDIVIRRLKLAIFVNGCYWHRHPGCRLAYVPKSHQDFWLAKFRDNVKRDRKELEELVSGGWRVLVIWECQVRSGEYATILAKELRPDEHSA
jgi:DNA mismatch endonuclease (patch repair protein)